MTEQLIEGKGLQIHNATLQHISYRSSFELWGHAFHISLAPPIRQAHKIRDPKPPLCALIWPTGSLSRMVS